MTKYMISFLEGAMQVPDEELEVVTVAAHAVVDEAKAAGVWVFGGGLRGHEDAATVSADGTVSEGRATDSPCHPAGIAVLDVESRADALEWARKIAAACRCEQEVRAFLPENRYDRD